jgi:hypothetical protein
MAYCASALVSLVGCSNSDAQHPARSVHDASFRHGIERFMMDFSGMHPGTIRLAHFACWACFPSILVRYWLFCFWFLIPSFSPTFQSISSLTSIDRMMVPLILIYAFFFGWATQHNAVLKGKAVALLVNVIIVSAVQALKMDPDHVRMIMTANSISMVMSVLGGEAMQW